MHVRDEEFYQIDTCCINYLIRMNIRQSRYNINQLKNTRTSIMLETVCDETCIISDTEREKIIIYIYII